MLPDSKSGLLKFLAHRIQLHLPAVNMMVLEGNRPNSVEVFHGSIFNDGILKTLAVDFKKVDVAVRQVERTFQAKACDLLCHRAWVRTEVTWGSPP